MSRYGQPSDSRTSVINPQALRYGARSIGSLNSSLDLPSRARSHLFLSLLLPGVSDSRIDCPRGDSSSRLIPATGRSFVRRTSTSLVRSFAALDFQQLADAACAVLGWHDRLTAAGAECLA